MEKIKLKFKKDRKVFVPERDIDLPDNYVIEIENPEGTKEMTEEEIEKYVQNLRDEFVKEFKEKYKIDMSNDPFLKLIGSEAQYLMKTNYKDDKKRIIEAVAEKYNRGYNG